MEGREALDWKPATGLRPQGRGGGWGAKDCGSGEWGKDWGRGGRRFQEQTYGGLRSQRERLD